MWLPPIFVGLATMAVVAIVCLINVMQVPGWARAAAATGQADHAVVLESPEVGVGTSGQETSQALVSALDAAGATHSRVSYFASSIPIDNSGEVLEIEEDQWDAAAFAGRFVLTKGRMPSAVGEIAGSPEVATKFRLGSAISLLSGALNLHVVGVARDESARDVQAGYLPLGTWDSLAHSGLSADKFDVSAIRKVYWSGIGAEDGAKAIAAALGPDGLAAGITPASIAATTVTQSTVRIEPSSPLLEIALFFLVPALAIAFIAGWPTGRFLARIRRTLLQIGVVRTRMASLIAVLASAIAFTVFGAAVGYFGVFLARPLIDGAATNALSAQPNPAIALTPVLCAVVGSSLGLVTFSRRGTMSVADSARADLEEPSSRSGAWMTVVVATVLFVGGIILSGSTDVNLLIGATLLAGAALVLLLTLGTRLIGRSRTSSLATLLALRRMSGESRAASRVIAGLGMVLLIACTSLTLYSSSYGTLNENTESKVPPGQVWLEANESVQTSLASAASSQLGTPQQVEFTFANESTTLEDGATLIVNSERDLEKLTATKLNANEKQLLQSGGTLRTKSPSLDSVTFKTASDAVNVPALTVPGFNSSFRRVDGFVLAATAQDLGFTSVRAVTAFVGLEASQVAFGKRLPEQLGFDANWIDVYEDPDELAPSDSLNLIVFATILLSAVICILFANTVARELRPRLAALRSVGVKRSWIYRVALIQIVYLIMAALVSAILASVGAVSVMLARSAFEFDLHVPWASLGLVFVGLLLSGLAAIPFSIRQLRSSDRFR